MGTPCQAEGQGRALESCNPSRPGPAPSVPGAGVIQMPFNPHGKCLQRRPLASVLGPLGAAALPPSPAPSSDHTAPAPASITSGGRGAAGAPATETPGLRAVGRRVRSARPAPGEGPGAGCLLPTSLRMSRDVHGYPWFGSRRCADTDAPGSPSQKQRDFQTGGSRQPPGRQVWRRLPGSAGSLLSLGRVLWLHPR